MKFSILPAALLFGSVLAEVHNFCACGKRHGSNAVEDSYWDFDTAATTYACTRYRNRNTGKKQWDNCPDCKMDTSDMDGWSGTPSCFSFGFHMGGDEFDYYCGLKGRQGYCQNEG